MPRPPTERYQAVIPMTHIPETDVINRFHFLATVFGAGFSYHTRLERKFLAPKINVPESDVDDEFAEVAAIIIAGIVAKGQLKRNKS